MKESPSHDQITNICTNVLINSNLINKGKETRIL